MAVDRSGNRGVHLLRYERFVTGYTISLPVVPDSPQADPTIHRDQEILSICW
jgi:hypothetical protein